MEARAASSNGVAAINLSNLPFKKEDDELSYVEVSTSKLSQGREAFLQEYGEEMTALFDNIHGSAIYGPKGIGALLFEMQKNTTRIYFLNPDYVKEALSRKDPGTMISRAVSLEEFIASSDAVLIERSLYIPAPARGVARAMEL